MLSEKYIDKFCKINNYSYNYFGDVAIITTGVDQWYLELVSTYNERNWDYEERVRLKHKNRKGNRAGKAHFHTQRYVKDIDCAFQTIRSHEENSRDFNKAFKVKSIINAI